MEACNALKFIADTYNPGYIYLTVTDKMLVAMRVCFIQNYTYKHIAQNTQSTACMRAHPACMHAAHASQTQHAVSNLMSNTHAG